MMQLVLQQGCFENRNHGGDAAAARQKAEGRGVVFKDKRPEWCHHLERIALLNIVIEPIGDSSLFDPFDGDLMGIIGGRELANE